MNHTALHSAYFFRGDIIPVCVETTITDGIGIHVIGLPDSVVKSTLLRVVSALQASGFHLPAGKIVIKVEPHGGEQAWAGAFRPRECSEAYDLAIALGILIASGQVASPAWREFPVDEVLIIGKLATDGTLQAPYTGIDGEAAAAVLEYQTRTNWSEIVGYPVDFYGRCNWDNCYDLSRAAEKVAKF